MLRLDRTLLALACAILATMPSGCRTAPPGESLDRTRMVSDEALPAGSARWSAIVPADWNGTLLLYSRGFSGEAGTPEPAPERYAAALLDRGYALAGSNYGAGGWAIEQALPAQTATLSAFRDRFGQPRRTIAWGSSMGGLITIALAERPAPIDGAMAMCGSLAGSLAMMNTGLDGAFAFRTLIAPRSDIRVTAIDDDRANLARVREATEAAMQTGHGRARLLLAGVLGGLPDWSDPTQAAPAADDAQAIAGQMAKVLPMGVFLPRTDQEARAGGVFSWNRGTDYARLLDRSGRRGLVEQAYREAGASLEDDLARLARASRIDADPEAVDYMARNYRPSAEPKVPVLAMQAMGDGITSPSFQRDYADAASPVMVRSVWTRAAGHCRFSTEEALAGLLDLERRIDSGDWGPLPETFAPFRPAPLMRTCIRDRACD